MGGSRGESLGSYTSSNVSAQDVVGKYITKAADDKVTEMEKDIISGNKGAKKKERMLKKQAARKKAVDLASLERKNENGNADESSVAPPDIANIKNISNDLNKRSVEDVFGQFDVDGSGVIDFEEFRAMLPQLGITISMPKALKYFRLCDVDGTGEIDLEEFKVAMFTVDPDSGNSVGFTPNALLTPLDAFEMFDEDKSGRIDEDEFFFLLRYLGLEITEQKQEHLFKKYDADNSGFIEYPEFKKIWVGLSNVKKELTDRGVKIPKLATQWMLARMLEQIIDAEEERERQAMAEAERWTRWQKLLKDKRRAYAKARKRSVLELKSALDAAGSVWLFGVGPFKEFTAPPVRVLTQGAHESKHYGMIRDIWSARVDPPATRTKLKPLGQKHRRRRQSQEYHAGKESKQGDEAHQREVPQEGEEPKYEVEGPREGSEVSEEGQPRAVHAPGDGDSGKLPAGDASGDQEQEHNIDPEEDARTSPFAELCVAQSTAALWGRRVVAATTSDSAAFAISELGEGYAWGGKDHWWFNLRSDSHWQTRWRGDTTERSQLLLQTTDKAEPTEVDPKEASEDDDEAEMEKLKTLTTYFGVWRPPSTDQRLAYVREKLVPKIMYEQVKHSVECRGKHVGDMNKTELLDMLYDDIRLEKKVLGELAHRRIRQLELDAKQMCKKGRHDKGKGLRMEIERMWIPVKETQAEDAAVEREKKEAFMTIQHAKTEECYVRWREHLKESRDHVERMFASCGNSMDVSLGGVTERGGGIRTPRGDDATVAITAGANHALLLHRSGQLYTWGVGSSGRLGLDLLQGGNPQGDAPRATMVQIFAGRPVIRASAGFNHSAAITSSGRLYSWGSAATGKLGLGTVEADVYCCTPTRVVIDSTSKIKEVSCGAAHTACVTASGQLFVWGCGDGGRLGLGPKRLHPQYEPVLVAELLHERIGSVSCGNSHTLVLTAIREVFEGRGVGREKVLHGGQVLQAGSTNVLGKFCPEFSPLRGLEELTIRQVSAGYTHSCCISTEGELYTWGNNQDGCLGHAPILKFIDLPKLVTCLYVSPKNLALGRPARQSSVYDDLGADVALDGDTSSDNPRKCTCTQQDPQAWWEVDLGHMVHVYHVKVWNRCDEPTDPSLEPGFFSKRLFPCWVMASQNPFGDDVGGTALQGALKTAVARARLTEEKRCSLWVCPTQTMARYIRVQLEGFDYLHLAQVEVFGISGVRRFPGKVTQCHAGKYITTAVVGATDHPANVELTFKKAVQADAFNAEVLRELETFFCAYDEWGRGDAIKGCLLCKAGSTCEVCALKHEFRGELRKMPLGPGGGLRPLSGIAQYLFDAEKPKLDNFAPVAKGTGTVLETVRGGLSKIFGIMKGSTGDLQSRASTSRQSSASTVTSNSMSDGRRGGRRIRRGRRGRKGAVTESQDSSTSVSSMSGGGSSSREVTNDGSTYTSDYDQSTLRGTSASTTSSSIWSSSGSGSGSTSATVIATPSASAEGSSKQSEASWASSFSGSGDGDSSTASGESASTGRRSVDQFEPPPRKAMVSRDARGRNQARRGSKGTDEAKRSAVRGRKSRRK